MNKVIVAFSVGLLMALTIIAFFLVGMNIGSNMDNYYSPAPEMAIELECPEGNIESRASCFINYVYGFHNYQQSTDFYMKSLEKLKKEGGDCLNYALLYKELAIKHGYKAKVVSLLDGYYGHAVTIMYDKTGYCIMDILYKFCMAL